MTFTLTLLGTDTQFTPKESKEGYDKAETLSYVSTLIASESDSVQVDNVVRYKNPDVEVIDGPTTLGTEVGDRIARGVLAILEAVSRGETNISIIAHSRGGVEAILVAHELERIQKLLAADQEQTMQNSVCKYTETAMKGSPHKERFGQLNIPGLKEHIKKLNLSIFNIDPVPGGNYMVLTKPTYLAWRDPRYYQVPAIVKKYTQYSYLNERTRCFKGIVPKPVSDQTEFTLESLPGHHGTGSGNLKDQQRRDFPQELRELTVEHVQQLVLLKLIDFLRQNKVNLDLRKARGGPFETILGGLESVFHDDLAFRMALNELYREQYELIMKNKRAYDHFNTTSYAVLGKEQSIQGLLWKVLDQRIVHYQSHNDTFLPSVVPVPSGGKFLNYEHARLYLNQRLGLSTEMSLPDKIRRSVEGLVKICNHARELKNLQAVLNVQQVQAKVEVLPLNTSVIDDKMAHAVNSNSKEGYDLILEALSILVEEVRKPFLMDVPALEGVYKAVEEAFTKLKAPELQDNELAQNILKKLNADLEQVLVLKRGELFNNYNQICTYMKGGKFFDGMIATLNQTLKDLSKSHESTDIEASNLSKQLLLIVQNSTKLKNASVQEKKQWIQLQIEHLGHFEEELQSSASKDICRLVLNTMSEAVEESENYSIPEIMKDLLQVNHKLRRYRDSLKDFRGLYSELPYDQWDQEAEEKQSNLIVKAAEYIVREKLDLEQEIKPIFDNNEDLYHKIANAVYGLGVRHPLSIQLEQLQGQFDQISRKLQSEEVNHLKAVEQLKLKSQKVEELQQALAHQKELNKALQSGTEMTAENHIMSQLIPLTMEYINHLQNKANKLGFEIDMNTTEQLENPEQNETYQAIRKKYLITVELLNILNDKENNPLPSQRIVKFTELLSRKDKELKEHRDPIWIQYAKNCLVGVGIAFSLIIPGLVTLLAVSHYGNKSSPLFFTKSGGEEYIDKLQNTGIKLTV
ncbi:hypothetical protein [Legionella waltersii]|uniref:Uncharacterized protein n=1 Tax=Legionella waltersii TaxID=66969 RepID=A0A0W1A2Q2_9GAMM|nr:hypothetical protein [Legionella waltersii]KTD75604.1 hypothetical protein Lwal_2542 [Legionella waltersii]SNV03204.1 Uncharacterised protein [Legionella waltersii]